jgi:hypothetical protein
VAPTAAADSAYVLDFEQIAHVDENGVTCHGPVGSATPLAESGNGEHKERLQWWLSSLVPDYGWESSETEARFVVVAEGDRGELALPTSRPVQIDGCGCGMFEAVEVDAAGYIDHVIVRTDEVSGATARMKPLAKRSRESILETAHGSLRLA